MADFVHLHLHTEYSLLDGLNRTTTLMGKIKESGMDAVAITDHGVLYGAAEFWKNAKEFGIKPIIGCEIYLAPGDHKLRQDVDGIRYYHLVLLAQNFKGYQNLVKLVTHGQLEGMYYRPRVSVELLKKYNEGLICTTACLAGPLARHIVRDEIERAEEWLVILNNIFKDRFFLELQRNGFGGSDDFKEEFLSKYDAETIGMIKSQIKVNRELRRMADKYKLPLVATTDAHYLNKDDKDIQEILFCIKDGLQLNDPNKRSGYVDTYVKTPEEMKESYKDDISPLESTLVISEQIDKFDLKFARVQPKFWNLTGTTAHELLEKEVYRLAPSKYPGMDKRIKERIAYELEVINKKGYDDYFLIVGDLMQWARSQGIVVNVRGSAAGSVVAYILDITNVEPLKWNLVFERFLNLERNSPPDIDMDLQDDRREEVIQYAESKYGKEKVASIGAIGRLKTKAAIRDVARVMGIDLRIADKLSKMVITLFGKNYSINQMMEVDPEFAKIINSDPELQRLAATVNKIEGMARHFSTHACGYLITPEQVTDFVALQKDSHGNERPVTQFDGTWVDKLDLMKFDFLGLRNLTIIKNAFDLIEQRHGVRLDTKTIPENDQKTFDLLARGEGVGVFQLESPPMQKYLKQLVPEGLEDICFMLAAYRPGPMKFIPDYIECKHGRKKPEYLIPELEPILKVTNGFPIYQEQLLQICMTFGGFTLGEGDVIRNALKKKQLDILESKAPDFKKYFVENYTKYGEKEAEALWDQLKPFADYGFNKAHAASYAMVSYWSAYLKANYPLEFMAALLHSDLTDTERIVIDIKEAQRLGFKILPPSINKSDVYFTTEGDDVIRVGIGAVKNVSTKACEEIVSERTKNGDFAHLDDLIERVGVENLNKKSLECLIKVGCMDEFGERNALLAIMPNIVDKVSKSGAAYAIGQFDLFSSGNSEKHVTSKTPLPKLPPVGDTEKVQWEKELLGMYLTTHPLDNYRWLGLYKELTTIEELATLREGSKVKVVAIVDTLKKITTKKSGKHMSFMTLVDLTGNTEAVMFPETHTKFIDQIEETKPYIFEGTVNMRDDKLSLIVDSITSTDSMTQPKQISIDICKVKDKTQLEALSGCLDKENGDLVVEVIYGNNGSPKRMKRFMETNAENIQIVRKFLVS